MDRGKEEYNMFSSMSIYDDKITNLEGYQMGVELSQCMNANGKQEQTKDNNQ